MQKRKKNMSIKSESRGNSEELLASNLQVFIDIIDFDVM